MKFRWLVTLSDNGVKDEPRLQYWHESGVWKDVEYFECNRWEEEIVKYDPDAC
jgi:hypothetical protein